jgi:hypothetical protein
MLPDYPELKRKLNEKFEGMVKAEIEKEPLLSRIRKNIIHEGDALVVTSSDGYSSQTTFPTFESEFNISYEDLLRKGPEAYFEKKVAVAKDMASKLVGNVYAKMNEVTERTGNVVSAKKGEGITPQLILDLLEKMEINFDETGNPIMPEIHLSKEDYEKLNWQKIDPKTIAEIERRRREIIDKKRKEWIDREGNRKLVD